MICDDLQKLTQDATQVAEQQMPVSGMPVAAGACFVVLKVAVALHVTYRSRLYSSLLHKLRTLVQRIVSKVKRLQPAEEPLQLQATSVHGLPQSRPLRTIQELFDWTPALLNDTENPVVRDNVFNAASRSRIADVSLRISQDNRPKLLVCHDMQGGYKADRFLQGSTQSDAFRIWRWDCIDIFVYFSHHLVTIPPPAWIKAAHKNGTKVLGTLITEWSVGNTQCNKMFATRMSAQKVAEQLTHMASFYGFDGWLINVENNLDTRLIPNLIYFLSHLRACCRAVLGPDSMVMWYDAVTKQGQLRWQNHLTPLNQDFFDCCDAIYINYGWKAATPAQIAQLAGMRSDDVYLGTDVWGRGTFGGGKDDSHVALAAARAAGVSAALFAPGWLWEDFPRDGFQQRSDAWWDTIASVWPCKPVSKATSSICSNLCSGHSERGYWLEGEKMSDEAWHNIGLQQLQPNGVQITRIPLADEHSPPHSVGMSSAPRSQHTAMTRAIGDAELRQEADRHPQNIFSQDTTSDVISMEGVVSSRVTIPQSALPEDHKTQQTVVSGEAVVAATASSWRLQPVSTIAYTGGSCVAMTGPSSDLSSHIVLCRLFQAQIEFPSSGLHMSLVTSVQHNSLSSPPNINIDDTSTPAAGDALDTSSARVPTPAVTHCVCPVIWIRDSVSANTSRPVVLITQVHDTHTTGAAPTATQAQQAMLDCCGLQFQYCTDVTTTTMTTGRGRSHGFETMMPSPSRLTDPSGPLTESAMWSRQCVALHPCDAVHAGHVITAVGVAILGANAAQDGRQSDLGSVQLRQNISTDLVAGTVSDIGAVHKDDEDDCIKQEELSILLGQLSLTPQSKAFTQHGGHLLAHVCVDYATYWPDYASASSLPQVAASTEDETNTPLLGAASTAENNHNLQQAHSGSIQSAVQGAPMADYGADVASQSQKTKTRQGYCSGVVTCDVRWQPVLDASGRPMCTEYHVWARRKLSGPVAGPVASPYEGHHQNNAQHQTSVTSHEPQRRRDDSVTGLSPKHVYGHVHDEADVYEASCVTVTAEVESTRTSKAADQMMLSVWSREAAEVNDEGAAVGHKPAQLLSDASWAWLGVACTNGFHVRARIDHDGGYDADMHEAHVGPELLTRRQVEAANTEAGGRMVSEQECIEIAVQGVCPDTGSAMSERRIVTAISIRS